MLVVLVGSRLGGGDKLAHQSVQENEENRAMSEENTSVLWSTCSRVYFLPARQAIEGEVGDIKSERRTGRMKERTIFVSVATEKSMF